MNAYLKIIITGISFSLLTITAYAANNESPSFAGAYQCKRTDSSNVTTSYPLIITKNTEAYTFEWDNDSGNPVLLGSGVIHPSMPNLISVAFADPKDAKVFGVELFTLKSDGSLQADWALQSSKTKGSETCTKNK